MLTIESTQKQRRFYLEKKMESYKNICNCPNYKVRMDSLLMIETVERIGLRGTELIKSTIDEEKFDLIVGYKTNNTIIECVLVPLAIRYGVTKVFLKRLEDNIQNKYIVGYRNNMSVLIRQFQVVGATYLIKNDTYGYLKAQSFTNDIKYVLSALGEKKCIAHENKLKRLQNNLNKSKISVAN